MPTKDKKKQELIEARNTAEQMIYTAEKSVKDFGEKAGADVVKDVEEKVTALKEVKDKEDKAAIIAATETLSAAMQKIGEAMQAEAASGKAEGDDGAGSKEPVRDAEEVQDETEKKD